MATEPPPAAKCNIVAPFCQTCTTICHTTNHSPQNKSQLRIRATSNLFAVYFILRTVLASQTPSTPPPKTSIEAQLFLCLPIKKKIPHKLKPQPSKRRPDLQPYSPSCFLGSLICPATLGTQNARVSQNSCDTNSQSATWASDAQPLPYSSRHRLQHQPCPHKRTVHVIEATGRHLELT